MNNRIEPLTYWCQKILPLVYDDSLSYYEVLCKLKDFINDLVVNVNNNSDSIVGLNEAFLQLQDWVNNYFDNLDVQTEVRNAIDRMIESGEFQAIVDEAMTPRINIGSLVQNFGNSNFIEALNVGLKVSKYIYIPDGNYDLNAIGKIIINRDADILCGSDCKFTFISPTPKNTTDVLIKVEKYGRFKWSGGTFEIGNKDKEMYYNKNTGLSGCVFSLNGAKNAEIEKLYFTRNSMPNIIALENCQTVKISKCRFENVGECGIHLFGYNKNIEINMCSFKNMTIPTNYDKEDIWYCYAIATGLHYLSEVNPDGTEIEPPEGFIVKNCYVENSEDSGIDTHGARNVIFENNTVINTGVCFTAYNDSKRVKRPKGWVMENVVIRNNFCKSNVVPPNRPSGWPDHPYILISNADVNSRNCRNYLIQNNYFESNNSYNDYGVALLSISRVNDIIIENCTFKNNDSRGKQAIYTRMCNNVVVKNCELLTGANSNCFTVGVDYGCNIEVKKCNSFNGKVVYTLANDSTIAYVDTDDYNYYFQQIVRRNEVISSVAEKIGYISRGYYLCDRTAKDSVKDSVIKSVGNNRYEVTIKGNKYFYGCGLGFNDGIKVVKGVVTGVLSDDTFLVQCEEILGDARMKVQMLKADLIKVG